MPADTGTPGRGRAARKKAARERADDAASKGEVSAESAAEAGLTDISPGSRAEHDVTSDQVEGAIETPDNVDPAASLVGRADTRRIEWLENGKPTGRFSTMGWRSAQRQVSIGRAQYAK